MEYLSLKQLTSIEDQVSLEQTMIRKYEHYTKECTDQKVRQKCEQILAKHQKQYAYLMQSQNQQSNPAQFL